MSTNPLISVLVPALNEADNLPNLISEIIQYLDTISFEVIVIDDHSTDETTAILRQMQVDNSWLRQIQHEEACGQSAAIRTGLLAARGDIIVTIDGDGQNDPRYIPQFVAALQSADQDIGLVGGHRIGRANTLLKNLSSRSANAIRRSLLGDTALDSGCGFKAIRRSLFLKLPYFNAWHRFMPALVAREGLKTLHIDIVDRPRTRGVSKYGFWDRAGRGLVDLLGVWWLKIRFGKTSNFVEIKTDV